MKNDIYKKSASIFRYPTSVFFYIIFSSNFPRILIDMNNLNISMKRKGRFSTQFSSLSPRKDQREEFTTTDLYIFCVRFENKWEFPKFANIFLWNSPDFNSFVLMFIVWKFIELNMVLKIRFSHLWRKYLNYIRFFLKYYEFYT